MSQLLTLQDVAKALKVSGRHIYNLVNSGAMPRPVRCGRAVRWRADEIDGWLQAGCPAADTTAAKTGGAA